MAIQLPPKPPIFPKEDEEIIARDKDGNVDTLKTIINIADKILSSPRPFDDDKFIIRNSDKSDK